MRIAVSGTHCVGKSTLIEEFLRAHPDFAHEPEPYRVMVEDHGEEFAAEPCVEDFYRQLEFNIDRLRQHTHPEPIIYERCPLDFVAYIAAIDPKSVEASLRLVSDVMQHLDLIVYLPLDDVDNDAEFPKLRRNVDRQLRALLMEDDLGLIGSANVIVVEATGSTAQRLSILERAGL